MRFDVHQVRCHLVNELMQAPQVKEVWHDGSDVVILDFKTGETVSIHMVERYMSLDEIEYIFTENARNGLFTMLILWGAMFMPSDGQVYEPDDWMRALLHLYGGKIYAFDAWRTEPFIFPVSFTRLPDSNHYVAHHGEGVNIGKIGVHVTETETPLLRGHWRVARFEGYTPPYQDDFWDAGQHEAEPTIRFYLNLLGISVTATPDEAKTAYRDLARKFHPDRNTNDNATIRMQQINDAYQRVLRYLETRNRA
ncbi:MAG: J domain-containing protein [Chloroflexota bacterium]